ncbi:GNAT family N-acetyltransferase [Enterococcus gallinarum]|uniref:GNAT family N-acetyltransferase n=1 Tax=Enterococcus gallinarum TaxID=1353 RepID=UPI0011DD0CDB|nr:GNAT family N-acetyltransferase [Enterococcus gallinarum]TXT70116.1 GNAT family N-acetyltransferase [Enterococcus gallinarum]
MDIQLEKVTYQTLPIAYRIQKESFKQLFEQYQDTETSPYLETYENFSKKYQRENNYFYLIQADGSAVGFVRIVLSEAPALVARVAPICILPANENHGIGKMAIQLVEAKFSSIKTWQLSTILQETRLLSFYQTLGYQLSDRMSPIVTGMDRVFLTKHIH